MQVRENEKAQKKKKKKMENSSFPPRSQGPLLLIWVPGSE